MFLGSWGLRSSPRKLLKIDLGPREAQRCDRASISAFESKGAFVSGHHYYLMQGCGDHFARNIPLVGGLYTNLRRSAATRTCTDW